MSAQKGKDLLVKISDGAGGFTAVAGLRTRRLAFNAETVDITNAESSNRWRELLDGAGCDSAALPDPRDLVGRVDVAVTRIARLAPPDVFRSRDAAGHAALGRHHAGCEMSGRIARHGRSLRRAPTLEA